MAMAIALTSVPPAAWSAQLQPGLPHGSPLSAPTPLTTPRLGMSISLTPISLPVAAMTAQLSPAPTAADSLVAAAGQTAALMAPNVPLTRIKETAGTPFETAGTHGSDPDPVNGKDNPDGAAGGNGDGNHPLSSSPSEAPILHVLHPVFPGTGSMFISYSNPQAAMAAVKALGTSQYAVVATWDKNENLQPTATLCYIAGIRALDTGPQIEIVPLIAVKITGFGQTAEGDITAKIEHIPSVEADPENVRLLDESARLLLRQYSLLNPQLPKSLFDGHAPDAIGVATGLSVRGSVGSTLNVEVAWETGTGKLQLRKQFGDDIEDSARNALKYVKKNAAKFGLERLDFSKIDIDITPAGKVDGPSAGGLMVTAIVSALTGRAVSDGVAMTGEITMRGDILPIGGLREKAMAAHRMGYRTVIYPVANQNDVLDIPQEVRDELELRPVATYDEILPLALEPAVTGQPAPLAKTPPPLFQARRPLAHVPAPPQPAVWWKPWTWRLRK